MSKSLPSPVRSLVATVVTVVTATGLSLSAAQFTADAAVGRAPAAQQTRLAPHTAFVSKPPSPAGAPSDTRLTATTLPAAGAADVPLAASGRPGRAGRLPILLGLSKPSGRSTSAHVELLDRAAASRAGVAGVLFTVATTAPTAIDATVQLDYSSFAQAFGAEYGSRLRLVRLPACALTTPALVSCRQSTPLTGSANSASTGTVSATVGLPAPVRGRQPVTVLAAVSGPSGSQGAFTATSLAPSGSWSVSGAAGSFDWQYPITLPSAGSGSDVAPTVALSYDSSAVDGRISSTNNQSSWIGEGWSYSPGYIERTYRSCRDDPAGTAPKTDDLCWAGQLVTMNLGGQSTSLVFDDATHIWHPASDNGQKVELLTGNPTNGANNGEYWRITTVDGIEYYFGLDRAPGATSANATNSTWTVPVYGAHSGDPCYSASGFAASRCAQAWRWNLDYVEDPHGNAAVYSYAAEKNFYGANNGTTGVGYTRGGTLKEIDYGMRLSSGSVYGTPAGEQVTFGTAERCISSTFSCDPSQFTAANASNWPDTPQDQSCATGVSCPNHAPTFWSTRRLTDIGTQYYSGSGSTAVDTYALTQSLPVDGDPELQLDKIIHTGHAADGTTLAMPPVSFTTVNMANRIDGYHTLGPMIHHRLTQIVSETGSTTAVTYSAPECSSTNLPASPTNNTKRCFPVYWTPPDHTAPILDYFQKYVVAAIQVSDNNAVSPSMITKYDYIGAPAWHADDNEVTKPAERSYGQFRGYGEVDVRTGNTGNVSNGVADALTLTKTTYYRGMGGSISDSLSESVTDDNRFADTPRETTVYLGDTTTRLSRTITDLSVLSTTASRARTGLPALTADFVVTTRSRTLTDVVQTGTVRTLTSTMRYDGRGQVTGKTETGDGVPTVCTTTSYADNSTSWIRNRVSETIVSSQSCPAAGTTPSPILSDSRYYYDSSTTLGTVGSLGDITRTETATDIATGGAIHYAVKTSGYDVTGRVLTTTSYSGDPNVADRTSKITYTPAVGPLATTTTYDAQLKATTTTLDPGRGSVTSTVTPAGQRTDTSYDPLGRLTAVWAPGQTEGSTPATTTYSYQLRQDAPSTITTATLVDNGSAKTYRTSVELLDAFGRVRQTQTQAYPSPGNTNGRTITDTFYDSHGWVIRTNNRWLTSGAPDTTLVSAQDTDVDDWRSTSYDGNGRATLATEHHQTTATWSTKTIYGGDRTTVFPPTGATPNTTITDARGRAIELDQWTTSPTVAGSIINGGSALKTTYHVDALGRQDQLTTAAGTSLAATWSSGFDLAGRVKSQSDPDSGNQTRSYDDLGDLTSTVDALNQTVSFGYDKLARKVATYSGTVAAGTKIAAWTYDTLQYGQLTSSTRYDTSGVYTIAATGFDAAGNQTGTKTSIPTTQTGLSGDFTTSYTYSSTHLMLTETPAAGGGLPAETITHSYTALGLPVGESGYNTYVSDSTYSPWGEPLQYTIGTNTHRAFLSYSYDQQTGRVTNTNYSSLLADPQLDNTAYTYDAAGDVTRTVDTQGGTGAPVRTECYQYDALIQLTQAWTATDNCASDPSVAGNSKVGGPGAYWSSWVIDAAGSRTQQTQHLIAGAAGSNTVTDYNVGVSTPTAHAHALKSTGPAGAPTTQYGYDAAGNTISRTLPTGTQTLTYDVENRLTSLTSPAGTTSYVNSADGATLIRRDPNTTTLFLDDEELVRTNSTGAVLGIRYYSHNGLDLNLRRGASNPLYLAPDAHGTQNTYINSTSYAAVRRNTDPYGAPVGTQPAWPDYHGYLGQPADGATGLTDLGPRQYDPTLGRFLSVDPVLDPKNPQQDNGYSYGWNNPVMHPDPTGMRPADDEGGIRGPDLKAWNDTQSQAQAARAASAATPNPYDNALRQFFGDPAAGAQRVVVHVAPTDDYGIILARFFIKDRDAAYGLLAGDDRGFTTDPMASFRIAMAWNTVTGTVTFTVAASTDRYDLAGNTQLAGITHTLTQLGKNAGNPVGMVSVLSGKLGTQIHRSLFQQNSMSPALQIAAGGQNDADISSANGTLSAKYKGLNSVLAFFAVNGTIQIHPGPGGFIKLDGDAYPNIEFVQYRSGMCPTILAESVAHDGGMSSMPGWPHGQRHESWNLP